MRRNLPRPGLRSWARLAGTALLSWQAAAAGPLEEMAPGTWYQVPDSKLQSVKPNPEPPGWSGFSGLFAWAGGCFDTKRDRLLIWGGGHADYTGNEIYAFDLNTLKWDRIWGPSPVIPASADDGTSDTYADGNPSSRHTYDNLAYNPARDALFSSGGSLSWGGQWTEGTWEYSLAGNAWSKRANAAASTFNQSAYDLESGHVFRVSESATEEFDPDANAWTKRSSNGNFGEWRMTGEIDPDRRVMVLLGGGRFHVLNLKTHVLSNPAPTGDTDILAAYAPGLAWDSRSRRLVAWSGGTAVYSIQISADLAAYTIRKIDLAPSNRVIPGEPNKQGTYSKFQYSPGKNVFLVVNQVSGDVYVYKPPQGAAAVPRPGGPDHALLIVDATDLLGRRPGLRPGNPWPGFPDGSAGRAARGIRYLKTAGKEGSHEAWMPSP